MFCCCSFNFLGNFARFRKWCRFLKLFSFKLYLVGILESFKFILRDFLKLSQKPFCYTTSNSKKCKVHSNQLYLLNLVKNFFLLWVKAQHWRHFWSTPLDKQWYPEETYEELPSSRNFSLLLWQLSVAPDVYSLGDGKTIKHKKFA